MGLLGFLCRQDVSAVVDVAAVHSSKQPAVQQSKPDVQPDHGISADLLLAKSALAAQPANPSKYPLLALPPVHARLCTYTAKPTAASSCMVPAADAFPAYPACAAEAAAIAAALRRSAGSVTGDTPPSLAWSADVPLKAFTSGDVRDADELLDRAALPDFSCKCAITCLSVKAGRGCIHAAGPGR